ncbi:MAG TPA: hypothetical protein PLS03_10360 [Terrimicrobiaceae bacterium]|nr:hypothetical protein [Terrimicrobiaceae bacterium]
MKTLFTILSICLFQVVSLIAADSAGFQGRSDSIPVSDYAENPLINYFLKISAFVDGYEQSKPALGTETVPRDLGVVFDNARKAAADFVEYYEKNRLQKQNKLPFVVALASTLQSNGLANQDNSSQLELMTTIGSNPSKYLLSSSEIAAYCDVMRAAEKK